MNLVKKVLKDMMTGVDGETYDPARIYGSLAVFTFLALAITDNILNKHGFDPQAFGIGFGALLAGFGLGVNLKSGTEPGETK